METEAIRELAVRLTVSEVILGATVGVRRHAANIVLARPDRHGAPPTWDLHVEGSCAELAVARALNLYCPMAVEFRARRDGDLKMADGRPVEVRCRVVGPGERVRTSLILHPEDDDSRVFVLVLGRCPAYTLVGWILGRDGKLARWWSDPAGGRPAFFVPREELWPMTDLVVRPT